MPDWSPSEHADDWAGCRNCGYFRGARCAAYPDQISFLIASGQVDHLVARPGQVGEFVFVPFDVEVFKATRQRVPARDSEPASRAG